MNVLKLAALPVIIVALSACHERRLADDRDLNDRNRIPELESFNIVDSYLTNSEFEPNKALRLSPYIDDGEFELFWEVQPDTHYRVELFLNDRPQPEGGISITTDWCGPGESCTNFSYQYCRYSADLRMQCNLPEQRQAGRDVDISWLIDTLPEQLYFTLEVCDEAKFYCETRSQVVTFE